MAKNSSAQLLSALRAVVLLIQQLTAPDQASTHLTFDTIVDLVRALGYVQIDTLQVV